MRRGFTLVEILVALVVLEVGLLGTVATLVLSSRLLARCVRLERGVADVESVLDSLELGAFPGTGSHEIPGGTVTWSVTANGRVTIRHVPVGNAPAWEIESVVPILEGVGP